eukprot:768601-Hanusia_phi.AAC.5
MGGVGEEEQERAGAGSNGRSRIYWIRRCCRIRVWRKTQARRGEDEGDALGKDLDSTRSDVL